MLRTMMLTGGWFTGLFSVVGGEGIEIIAVDNAPLRFQSRNLKLIDGEPARNYHHRHPCRLKKDTAERANKPI